MPLRHPDSSSRVPCHLTWPVWIIFLMFPYFSIGTDNSILCQTPSSNAHSDRASPVSRLQCVNNETFKNIYITHSVFAAHILHWLRRSSFTTTAHQQMCCDCYGRFGVYVSDTYCQVHVTQYRRNDSRPEQHELTDSVWQLCRRDITERCKLNIEVEIVNAPVWFALYRGGMWNPYSVDSSPLSQQ